MALEPDRRRVKLDIRVDPDMGAWLRQRAETHSISVSAVVRQILRAAMNAEYVARRDVVDTEQG